MGFSFNPFTGNLDTVIANNNKVKVSATDTTTGYLDDKIAAGTGIAKATLNPAGNEQISISCTITQYTDELAQDAVGGMVLDTNSIDLTYTDGTPSLAADLRLSANAADASYLIVSNNIEAAVSVGLRSQISYSSIRGLLSATSPISYDNSTGVISTSLTQYTDELAQDAIGGILVDTTSVQWTYDDVTPDISAVVLPAGVDHNSLANLTTGDAHTQYFLLAGRSGGQTAYGDTASGGNLTISSTAHATKGKIIFNSTSAWDEANDRLGLGTASPTSQLTIVGQVPTANTWMVSGASRYSNFFYSSDLTTVTIPGTSSLFGIDARLTNNDGTAVNWGVQQVAMALQGTGNQTNFMIANSYDTIFDSSGTYTKIVTNRNRLLGQASSASAGTCTLYVGTSNEPTLGDHSYTTVVPFDATLASGNHTRTMGTYIGYRVSNATKGANFTYTTHVGFKVESQTATIGTKVGFWQAGALCHNRFAGKTIFGIDDTTAASYEVEVVNQVGTGTRGLAISQHNSGAGAAVLRFVKSRNTYASPSAVTSGDFIGSFTGVGYDGSNYLVCAAMQFAVDGAVSSGVVPMGLVFRTGTADSASGGTSRMEISSAGQVMMDHSNSTLGLATLNIVQDDADEPFIHFDGTSAANANNNISTWTSGNTIQGFVRVQAEATDYWMPIYDAPTGTGGGSDPVNVHVTQSAGVNSNSSGDALVSFNTEVIDSDNAFTNTASNYKFTAPATGYYHFALYGYATIPANATSAGQIKLRVDGATDYVLATYYNLPATATEVGYSGAITLYLAASSYVQAYYNWAGASNSNFQQGRLTIHKVGGIT